MSNGILKRGTYIFGEDYKLIPDSYRPPKKRKKRSSRGKKHYKMPKKQLKIFLLIVGILFALLLASFTIATIEKYLFSKSPEEPETSKTEQEALIQIKGFDQEVLLCSVEAKEVYDKKKDISEVSLGDPYRPVVFEYQLKEGEALLRVSEQKKMTAFKEYTLTSDQDFVELHNLKTDTDYFYQVLVKEKVYSGSFHTAASPRFLWMEGAKNIRDIGGYKTLDGKTVKQGLLIRGTEIDGLVNPDYFISGENISQIQETFSFVYDMDLREAGTYIGEYFSRFGKEVKHKFYTAPSYGAIFNPSYIASVKEIFSDLANPANYPMYLHCTWGADRTGTVVYLLQGVLNVSQEDMLQEYMLTSFVNKDFHKNTNIEILIWGLEPYEGDTIQEKIVSYLTTTVGVTEEEIESIRQIFLEQ